MPEVPKIVHHRLREGSAVQRTQSHPETDVLAAFAEQALPVAEREGVLEHLALCADCREVVMLALPPMAEAVQTSAAEQAKNAVESGVRQLNGRRFAWFGLNWASLRWATLAAGIAVAIFVMRPAIDHLASRNNPANSATGGPVAVPKSAPPADVATAAVPESPKSTERVSSEAKAAVEAKNTVEARESVHARDEITRSLAAIKMKKEDLAVKSPAAKSTVTPPAPMPSRSDLDQVSRTANENVEVTAGANTTTVEVSAENGMVQTETAGLQPAPAIEKAKPPLDRKDLSSKDVNEKAANQPAAGQKVTTQEVLTSQVTNRLTTELPTQSRNAVSMQAAAAPVTIMKQAAIWAIVKGVLQRSLDGGKTWQTSVGAGHSLLCFAPRGSEVWAGGHAGTVMHSFDNGATWTAVAVSSQGHPLTGDVVHIDVRSPAEVVLSTENHETWTSVNGGQSWEKK